MACIISGSALLMLSVCSPVFKRITGIHHNPLTAIFLSSIFIGGSMGFLRTSYQGEFFYTMISIFSLYFLIFMAKCYYQSVRFEFALIAGILFSWLSMLLFRNSYYLLKICAGLMLFRCYRCSPVLHGAALNTSKTDFSRS